MEEYNQPVIALIRKTNGRLWRDLFCLRTRSSSFHWDLRRTIEGAPFQSRKGNPPIPTRTLSFAFSPLRSVVFVKGCGYGLIGFGCAFVGSDASAFMVNRIRVGSVRFSRNPIRCHPAPSLNLENCRPRIARLTQFCFPSLGSLRPTSRRRGREGRRKKMDPDSFRSTLSTLAFGNVMAAAARDYQKVPFFPSPSRILPFLAFLMLPLRYQSWVWFASLIWCGLMLVRRKKISFRFFFSC